MTHAHVTTFEQLLADNSEPGNSRRGILTGNEVAAVEAAMKFVQGFDAIVDAANRNTFERLCAERDQLRSAV